MSETTKDAGASPVQGAERGEETALTVEKLRRLDAAATPAPWNVHIPMRTTHIIDARGGYILEGSRAQAQGGIRGYPADAELIVAARNALPELLSEVARLTSEAASLRAALAKYGRHLAGCGWPLSTAAICTCGFEQALRGGVPTPREEQP